MSSHDLEPTTPPPGHGENVLPLPGHRCPECGSLVQNVRPATVKNPDTGTTHAVGKPPWWLGWCPDHGTVRVS